MSSKISIAAVLAALAASLSLALAGCGGNGSGSAGGPTTRKGQVQLHIVWPAKPASGGKYIPAYAASLFFELSPVGNPDQIYTLTVNRPSNSAATQDVMFNQLLAAGNYQLAGAARALADAQGATVASGAVPVNVQPGLNPVALTLSSTVKTLQILGQPITVGVGQAPTLQSGAFDPDGNGLLLPDGALKWSVVSGAQFGAITAGGKLTAVAAGVVKVQVAEPVTGVKAVADVTITQQQSTTGLAKSGYPIAGADTGSTGRVAGMGAKGQVAWSFDLKHRGINTPVLGNNNMLFALQQKGIVYGLDATTGVKKWQMTLPNVLGDLSGGSLAVGDDNTLYVGYTYGLQAYDSGTGLPKWNNADFSATGSINLAAGKIYVPSMNQGVGVIDARTGKTVTTYPGLSDSYDVVIANGIAYYITETVGGSTRGADLMAINTATGATAWSKHISIAQFGGYIGGLPVVGTDGTVYVALGDGKLTAFNGLNGSVKGTVDAPMSSTNAKPNIAADGSVYFPQFGTNNVLKTVHYNAALTMKLGSSDTTVKQMSVGPDSTVYGGGFDPQSTNVNQSAVFAFNGLTGTLKWKVGLNAGVEAATSGFGTVSGYPAVAKNGWIYVVSIDQRLYAIK